jgi:hypothetical protein
MTTSHTVTITKVQLRFLLDFVELETRTYFKKAKSAGKKGDKIAEAFWNRQIALVEERAKPLKEMW